MEKVIRFIDDNNLLRDFEKICLSPNGTIEITGASEEIGALLAMRMHLKNDNPVLIVGSNLYHAQLLYDKLSSALGEERVLFFPQDEFVTTEMLVSSAEFRLERINTAISLSTGSTKVVVTNLPGLLRPMVDPEKWKKAKISVVSGAQIPLRQLIDGLFSLGYNREYTVEKMGDYSVRGGIVDLFPLGQKHPVRLDLFGDFIETIKVFDVETQRSIAKIDAIDILPMTDILYDDDDLKRLKNMIEIKVDTGIFNQEAREKLAVDMENFSARRNLDRLHRYLPLITDKPYTLIDYLPEATVFFMDRSRLDVQYRLLVEDIAAWYDKMGDYAKAGFSFLYPWEQLSFRQTIDVHYFDHQRTDFGRSALAIPGGNPLRFAGNLNLFLAELKTRNPGMTAVVVTSGTKAREQLCELMDENEIGYQLIGRNDQPVKGGINLIVSEAYFDLYAPGLGLMVITETAFKPRAVSKNKGRYVSVYDNSRRLASINDLNHGDYVVHYDYGIGRFLDIKTMELGNTKNDYIHLEYRDGDKLYIPLESFSQIHKYAGSEGFVPRLSKLGGSDWERTKQRVKHRVRIVADRLIALYSERERATGFAYDRYPELEGELQTDFPYVETSDQLRAIAEVFHDMAIAKPMDRLLCGDVGFGKTEVALRAAFRAVLNNKQVAYLAPTTVLSKQHYQTFSERLDKFGVRVALLNRFTAKKQQREILAGLRAKTIDILIGTHRILSADVAFADLGLLVVDEEQRFGVEHKEKIKEMKVSVDVLTLSATPIPRTLQMAIMGVKNMSLLESAPENRYPIQTYVLEQNDTIVKDAIERELARKGQVFYLYNRIDNIENIAFDIAALVPDARVRYAHGQMPKHELEDVVEDFINRDVDVLVSTTIIETGIDIPNANTLIVHEADRLGLSQLYQIRGRVGRSDRIAYAYLMYKGGRQMTEDAEKRLKVIKEFTELGSGFKIAVRDLSIRGAGDILGAEQSGFIDSVGIDLYLKILEEEIKEKQGVTKAAKPTYPIKANVSRYIDEEYVSDDFVKIEMHKKINEIDSIKDINELLEEFADRFGKFEPELEIYIYERLFEKLTVKLGVDKMVEKKTNITLVLTEDATKHLAGDELFRSGMQISRFIRFAYKNNKIQIILDTVGLEKHWLYTMVEFLAKITNQNHAA